MYNYLSLQLIVPNKTSECPPKYFVPELSVISTPKSEGVYKNGVANVLSTTIIAFSFWLRVAYTNSLIFVSFIVGFVGVSR